MDYISISFSKSVVFYIAIFWSAWTSEAKKSKLRFRLPTGALKRLVQDQGSLKMRAEGHDLEHDLPLCYFVEGTSYQKEDNEWVTWEVRVRSLIVGSILLPPSPAPWTIATVERGSHVPATLREPQSPRHQTQAAQRRPSLCDHNTVFTATEPNHHLCSQSNPLLCHREEPSLRYGHSTIAQQQFLFSSCVYIYTHSNLIVFCLSTVNSTRKFMEHLV